MSIGTLLATAGIKLGGWAASELFGGGEPELAPLQTGAMRAKYAAGLQDILGGRREEALSVARRESARSGSVLGGAYLENVAQIEQQINDIIGREISQYETQLMGAELDWETKRRQVAYAGQAQRRESRQAAIGDIFGTVAAYPMLEEQRTLREERWREIQNLLFPVGEGEDIDVPSMDKMRMFNESLTVAQRLLTFGLNPSEWERGMEVFNG